MHTFIDLPTSLYLGTLISHMLRALPGDCLWFNNICCLEGYGKVEEESNPTVVEIGKGNTPFYSTENNSR